MYWGLVGTLNQINFVNVLHSQPGAIYYIPILSLQHINNTVEMPRDRLLYFSGRVCIAVKHMFTASFTNNYILWSSPQRTYTYLQWADSWVTIVGVLLNGHKL